MPRACPSLARGAHTRMMETPPWSMFRVMHQSQPGSTGRTILRWIQSYLHKANPAADLRPIGLTRWTPPGGTTDLSCPLGPMWKAQTVCSHLHSGRRPSGTPPSRRMELSVPPASPPERTPRSAPCPQPPPNPMSPPRLPPAPPPAVGRPPSSRTPSPMAVLARPHRDATKMMDGGSLHTISAADTHHEARTCTHCICTPYRPKTLKS
mmetsp:Transcript_108740/g.188114  ORF Transcript_108740/g.188114 Transcript_108740/m.188114 type:complete len:208 (-) Transcript_108740:1999-2622(-)